MSTEDRHLASTANQIQSEENSEQPIHYRNGRRRGRTRQLPEGY